MRKDINVEHYASALNIIYGEWLEYTDLEKESIQGLQNTTSIPSPETLLIKYDSWDKLSQEAKEIIETILNAPIEIIEALQTPKRKKFSITMIKKYFQKEWKSTFITEATFEEIRIWANQL